MDEKNFKIVNFYAENVKKLKVIDITPDPDNALVTIAGRNGQGKTSILDSILWALRGKDEIQDMPIRQGEEKATIKLDLGEYIIKRTFTEKGTYLTVENQDGFKTTSPQKMLDDMMGNVTFDPLEFMRQKPADQYETLKSLVKLDIDIETLEASNKSDFEERTHVNRNIKELKAQIDAFNIPEDTPDEPYDVTEIANEIKSIEQTEREMESLCTTIENVDKQISDLKEQLQELEKKRVGLSGQKEELAGHPNMKKDVVALSTKLGDATTVNSFVQQKQQRAAKQEELTKAEAKAENYTKDIEKRKEMKIEALQKADFPIDGLSFKDGGVLFNDVPFDQISAAEQIKVSTAIGMSINPRIKVMRIKDGSLLDDASMGIISTLASENDFQVWIECVKSDDPSAVVIEDGEIKQ